jgi:hypothetical protein
MVRGRGHVILLVEDDYIVILPHLEKERNVLA